MAFLNQFSFLLVAAGLLLVLVLFLRRRGPADGSLLTLLALVIGLTFAFVVFRPADSEADSVLAVQAILAEGQPSLLEFQSPYCIACMAVEPVMKQIEFDYETELQVIRINVLEDGVDQLMKRYQFQYTPTFIFLNPHGEEVWRMVGTLDPKLVTATLDALQ